MGAGCAEGSKNFNISLITWGSKPGLVCGNSWLVKLSQAFGSGFS